jgi:pimeloyl-ACP methyl ester carboxylesterase
MTSSSALPQGLHFVAESPVAGLALAERRVAHPLATVICIHGGLDRGGSFARLARRSEQFDLLAYDRRGYQGSRALTPVDFEHHVEDLIAISEHEMARNQVLFFGHSFGGTVAWATAARRPELVKLAIAYESPLPWILRRESSRPQLTSDPNYEVEVFFRRMVSNSAWERLSERERESRRLDGPALLSDLSILRSSERPFELSELEVPALYLHGDQHHLDYNRELGRLLTSANPLIRAQELTNAGHGAHLSNPDQIARAIYDAWEQVCTSA